MKGTALNLSELFDMELLEQRIKEGYVKKTLHPELPLGILNYTDAATYDGVWDDVTTHCRGLIYRLGSGEVIARGPRKFFNYGEPHATNYPLSTRVRVTRKEDGSLGIGWCYVELDNTAHYGVATRGSFTSEQALHATEMVKRDNGHNQPYELWADAVHDYRMYDISYVGEIVYPENRIVLDYGGRDELIPLGTVNNRSGVIQWRPEYDHNGHKVVAHSSVISEVITLAEALALQIPDNEEGYVLDVLDEYLNVVDHIKLKGDWYKEMHAAIFGLTEKRVWEAWSTDNTEFFENLPDELQEWALNVSKHLDDEWQELRREVVAADFARMEVLGIGASRKDIAIYVNKHYPRVAPAIFATLDGNTPKLYDWMDKQVKPKGHVPFKASVNA